MNLVAERLCGWAKNEAPGEPLHEVSNIVNAETGEPVENPCTKVLTTGVVVGPAHHTMLISRDGGEYQITDSASPIRDENNNIVGVVIVFRDVTEQYEKDKQLRDRLKQLNGLYRIAQTIEETGITLGGILKKVTNVITESCAYPKRTSCRIILDDGESCSDGFTRGGRIQRTVLYVNDREHSFLDAVAIRLGSLIEKSRQEEKMVLLKETHHRIKNNISSIGSLLSVQASHSTDQVVHTALKDVASRVRSMGILYEKLLLGEDYRDVPVRQYVENLLYSIGKVYPDKNISLEMHIFDFLLSSDKIIPMGIIINELYTNIMKYAFPDGRDGYVSIRIEKDSDHVKMIMQDDGIGLSGAVSADSQKGFGLRLVKMLSEQLRGSFTIGNQGGTRSVLEFNLHTDQ